MPLKMFSPEPLPSIRHTIAIAAGKGGVGKSSLTVNLARALKWSGYAVGIMDTDIYGPSIRKMMKEDRLPISKGSRIEPAYCEGMPVISMAYFRKENESAVVRAPIANGIISQFIENVAWGALDFLLVDFPPGTGDIQLTLAQKAHLTGAIMITTPQDVAVLDVRKAVHMFRQVNVPIMGIVENMSYYHHEPSQERIYIFGKGGGERLAIESGVPFLGSIPIDPEICRAGDGGASIFSLNNTSQLSPAASIYIELAKQVISQIDSTKNRSPQIYRKDAYTFIIHWNDEQKNTIRFSDVQKECPCAACVDESTGRRLVTSQDIDPFVQASKISPVGSYALRFEFTSGCSSGLYSYEMLRQLLKPETV